MKIIYQISFFILLVFNFSCSSGNYVTCGTGAKIKMRTLDVNIISIKKDSLNHKVLLEGKVFDSKVKEAIVGANVILSPKSAIGTATDANGIFKLVFDPSKFDHLEVSFIGYHNKTVLLKNLLNKIK